ncbi:FeoA family protein [Sporomusa malonica]|uniref:Ferrous iron transport protein A n=1 Tax=Sporomusa malonica TaxID=112901 RepID=A0A1W2E9N1_9FIRM|nr:FeoA family protein [Sporomusa malonica]SMD05996.1 ferrous iron transport protein A [Sporomusa malonica]
MTEQSVTALKAGERARIVAINSQDSVNMRKLTVFGLLPGMEIEVVQTFPAYVLKIDNTQLALDHEAAIGIIVVKSQQGRI